MIGIRLTQDDLVFSTPEGRPLRPNTVTRAWTMLALKAGVKPIRLHDSRHTHATLMLKQGVRPKIVPERLGHSTIEMTLDVYSHVTPGLQEAAAGNFDRLLNPEREIEPVPDHY
jgi:integrase